MDSTYTTTYSSADAAAAAGIGMILLYILLIELALSALMIVSLWILFRKAGKPGWAAIVPIYNVIVELEIVGRPLWWIVLMFIPFVNIVVSIILMLDLAKVFGKSTGMGLLLVFLPVIGLPMLAFSKDVHYVGVDGAAEDTTTPPIPPMVPPAEQ